MYGAGPQPAPSYFQDDEALVILHFVVLHVVILFHVVMLHVVLLHGIFFGGLLALLVLLHVVVLHLVVVHRVVLGITLLHFVLFHLVLSESSHGSGQNTREHQTAKDLLHSFSLNEVRFVGRSYLRADIGWLGRQEVTGRAKNSFHELLFDLFSALAATTHLPAHVVDANFVSD
jgi:hypothetical protein